MGNIIAIVNPKGGSGKTTTALNLAAGLTRYSDISSSCLIIDMDPHGCATSSLLGKMDGEVPSRTLFDVLRGAMTPHDGVTSTVYDENIDLLPSCPALESISRTHKVDRLKKVTDALSTSYGWIIIDTPPNMGFLTLNALVTADYVIIPTQCTGLAVSTLQQVADAIDKVKERQNVWLQNLGVLITMKDGRTDLPVDQLKQIKKIFPRKLFKTLITNNIKIEEAPSNFNSIYSYDSGCLGASLYRDWVKGELQRKHKALEKKKNEKMEELNISQS
jgi:chromosome partitioning protein